MLSQIALKWREIATRLGLFDSTIDSIGKEYADDTDSQIRKIFQYWLRKPNGLPNNKYYPPTWNGLSNLLMDCELEEIAHRYFQFLKDC